MNSPSPKSQEILKLYQHLGIINRRLSILLSLNRRRLTSNPRMVKDFVIDSGKRLSNASLLALYKYDSKRKEFNIFGGEGIAREHLPRMQKLVLTEQSFLKPLLRHTRAQGSVKEKKLSELDLGSVLDSAVAVPLLRRHRLSGMILFGFVAGHVITTQELDFYETFGALASVTLQNMGILQ